MGLDAQLVVVKHRLLMTTSLELPSQPRPTCVVAGMSDETEFRSLSCSNVLPVDEVMLGYEAVYLYSLTDCG